MKPKVRQRPLSDLYDGKQRYEESFHEYFDAKYMVDLIHAVWKKKPPYRLLDVGSASGLTLQEFEELSVEAWALRITHTSTVVHQRFYGAIYAAMCGRFASSRVSSISPTTHLSLLSAAARCSKGYPGAASNG
jgi:hypothetical protein